MNATRKITRNPGSNGSLLSLAVTLAALAFLPLLSSAANARDGMGHDCSAMEGNITFRSGKVIEIVYASVEGGKEAQLTNGYLAKIGPIAAKYGSRILGRFHVTAVTGGEIHPQMIVLFEWPNLAALDRLRADKEAKKLFPIRDDAISFFTQGFYTVEKDVTVAFSDDKTYEFFNGWLTPSADKSLPEYFKQSDAPKQKYGPPKFLVDLKPLSNAPEHDFVLQPDMAGIVEWNNTRAYFGLIADPAFKKAAPLLDRSVSRLDMVHAKFDFPRDAS